jgi:hypothetical protein
MGLINHLLSVIVSRQMNPTIGCSCPPEPPVQDDEPVAFADTFTPQAVDLVGFSQKWPKSQTKPTSCTQLKSTTCASILN